MPKINLITGPHAPLTAEIRDDGGRTWIMTGKFVKNWYYLLSGNVATVEIVAGADPVTFDCRLRSGETFRAVAAKDAYMSVMALMLE